MQIKGSLPFLELQQPCRDCRLLWSWPLLVSESLKGRHKDARLRGWAERKEGEQRQERGIHKFSQRREKMLRLINAQLS